MTTEYLEARHGTTGWIDKTMTLFFTESKADSNLCFKVEGKKPVMLLLCVDALFSRHGGVTECGWNLPQTWEVCNRDPEEVQDDGLQGMTTPMASNLKLLSVSLSRLG